MIRLFVTHNLGAGGDLNLPAEQAHYLVNVMRLEVGKTLRLFNGRDGEWAARLTAVAKRGASLRVETLERAQHIGPDLDLIVALIKRPRLETIVEKAAEQTGRLDVPQVSEPEKLDRVLKAWDPARRLMFCDEAGDAAPVLTALADATSSPWAILIGPEGGFSPAERARIRAVPGAVPVSLGPRILRADTAAIAAMTLWQAAIGDWRTP